MLLSSHVVVSAVICGVAFCDDALFGSMLFLYMMWACCAAGASGGVMMMTIDDEPKIFLCALNLDNGDD